MKALKIFLVAFLFGFLFSCGQSGYSDVVFSIGRPPTEAKEASVLSLVDPQLPPLSVSATLLQNDLLLQEEKIVFENDEENITIAFTDVAVGTNFIVTISMGYDNNGVYEEIYNGQSQVFTVTEGTTNVPISLSKTTIPPANSGSYAFFDQARVNSTIVSSTRNKIFTGNINNPAEIKVNSLEAADEFAEALGFYYSSGKYFFLVQSSVWVATEDEIESGSYGRQIFSESAISNIVQDGNEILFVSAEDDTKSLVRIDSKTLEISVDNQLFAAVELSDFLTIALHENSLILLDDINENPMASMLEYLVYTFSPTEEGGYKVILEPHRVSVDNTNQTFENPNQVLCVGENGYINVDKKLVQFTLPKEGATLAVNAIPIFSSNPVPYTYAQNRQMYLVDDQNILVIDDSLGVTRVALSTGLEKKEEMRMKGISHLVKDESSYWLYDFAGNPIELPLDFTSWPNEKLNVTTIAVAENPKEIGKYSFFLLDLYADYTSTDFRGGYEKFVRFTTDGSEPTVDSPLLGGTFFQEYQEAMGMTFGGWGIIVTNDLSSYKFKAFDTEGSADPSVTFSLPANQELAPLAMIRVDGGRFFMGHDSNIFPTVSTSTEITPAPVTEVEVSTFILSATEVSQKEFSQVFSSKEYSTAVAIGDSFPATNISWYEAIAYCNKRSADEGLVPVYTIAGIEKWEDFEYSAIPTARDTEWDAVVCDWFASGYRLPSEAEWELAAGGGLENRTDYSGTSNLLELPTYAIYNSSDIVPVEAIKPNRLGFYHMSGNVLEHVWNWVGDYSGSFESTPYGPSEPTGNNRRILRGGAADREELRIRVQYRAAANPTFKSEWYGFRVARSYISST